MGKALDRFVKRITEKEELEKKRLLEIQAGLDAVCRARLPHLPVLERKREVRLRKIEKCLSPATSSRIRRAREAEYRERFFDFLNRRNKKLQALGPHPSSEELEYLLVGYGEQVHDLLMTDEEHFNRVYSFCQKTDEQIVKIPSDERYSIQRSYNLLEKPFRPFLERAHLLAVDGPDHMRNPFSLESAVYRAKNELSNLKDSLFLVESEIDEKEAELGQNELELDQSDDLFFLDMRAERLYQRVYCMERTIEVLEACYDHYSKKFLAINVTEPRPCFFKRLSGEQCKSMEKLR